MLKAYKQINMKQNWKVYKEKKNKKEKEKWY